MYVVIGVGLMGLVMVRNFVKQGLFFVGYELNSDVGGLWDIDNFYSIMYEIVYLIFLKWMIEFCEFFMDEWVVIYLYYVEFKCYFQDYVCYFGFYDYYQFNICVLLVILEGEGWCVIVE